MSSFDFELSFTTIYDDTVLADSSSPDKDSSELKQLIQNAINNMQMVMQLQPGINNMTTYVDYNTLTYKVNFTK